MTALKLWVMPALLAMAALLVVSLAGTVQASGGSSGSSDEADRPAPNAPEVRFDVNLNGYIDYEELDGIIASFFAEQLSREDLVRLVLLNRQRGYVPPPSLLEMRDAAPWYQDGIDHSEEGYSDEESAVGTFTKIALNCAPQVARGISQWTWAFDEDMSPNESQILGYLGHLCQTEPASVPTLTGFTWLADGPDNWEVWAMGLLYATAWLQDPEFAAELATLPWVADGITVYEALYGLQELDGMAWHSQGAYNIQTGVTTYTTSSPQLARKFIQRLGDDPRDFDFIVLSAANSLRVLNPDAFLNLLDEPWFLDGLDDAEGVYLRAAVGGGATTDELFGSYSILSSTIDLPITGWARLWVVRHREFDPEQDVIAIFERAVRGVEDFMQQPLPERDLILYLSDRPGYRGLHLGTMMSLGAPGWASDITHETAHYFFNEGPTWLNEGAANYISARLEHDGTHPPIDFPTHCVEGGYGNLQSIMDRALLGGPLWDSCRYSMGQHFLVTLQDTIGEDALIAILREAAPRFLAGDEYGWQIGNEGDDVFYRIVLDRTAQEHVEAVKDVFRRLHGGPFVEAAQP